MKLISMIDFVISNQRNDQSDSNAFFKCVQYANFLKQPLELGMFVPVDEGGNVLEEPKNKDYNEETKVLFEGFEVEDCKDFYILKYPLFEHAETFKVFEDKFKYKTIEDLVKYNITLTENAIKKLGL